MLPVIIISVVVWGILGYWHKEITFNLFSATKLSSEKSTISYISPSSTSTPLPNACAYIHMHAHTPTPTLNNQCLLATGHTTVMY